MQKAERKRRAAERKRKAKLAKRAKRKPENQPATPGGNPEESKPATAASEPTGSAEVPAKAEGTADRMPAPHPGEDDRAYEQPQRSRPDLFSLKDEVHMSYSKMNRAEAEVIEAGTAEMLGDDEAVAILTRAARSLDNVIQYVESVLKRLPAEQVAEAIAITNEPRRAGEKSRNGANPAVQLLNIRLRAKNLLMRVMKVLKPNLAKQMQMA